MDITEEIRTRQARWMTTIVNNRSIVGNLHRGICCREGTWSWDESSKALKALQKDLDVAIQVNQHSVLIDRWPFLHAEATFQGEVCFEPRECAPNDLERNVVFTDGSVEGTMGGAAAWRWDTNQNVTFQVVSPSSSTECEMVGLISGLTLDPQLMVTDSLTALH